MTHPRFIHLRNHSAYSLLEGAIQVKDLVKLAVKAGMPAVALSDTNNLFAALEFSEAAKAAGVQPILGCQLALASEEILRPGDRALPSHPVVLLAQNEAGYGNLMKLTSAAFLLSAEALPHVTLDQLDQYSVGIICLTGGALGPLGMHLVNGQVAKARALAVRLKAMFGDRLYVELQRHADDSGALTREETASEAGLISLAYELELPLVATNDVYFADPGFYAAHDALICIAEGAYVDQQEPRRRLTPEHHFKQEYEMVALFRDLPEALGNTVEIAKRCAVAAQKRKPILPRFAENEVEELRVAARAGLQARLAVIPLSVSREDYAARLEFELDVIIEMGFPGYFLIVADFIKWAKGQNIPVGPGRGSGAGSLVAYALTITDIDPLRFGLLFERMLNPERVSMPDFDIDFCMDRREEVIAYVQQKYGRDRVAQIITFGALLSKMAVRDVGRVLQMPYGQVDRIAKLIPVEGVKPVSIEKALADEPRLRDEAKSEEVVARMLGYAQQVEGLLRNASTHAAGVVIGDRPLEELVPLYRDPRSDMPATQFNMKWVEAAGLVKFDFLGLKTLTVIQNALDLLRLRGVDIDIASIPLDDARAYQLYSDAATVAVFQVESAGMREALRQLAPTCIEDIIALVALYRPGPMENIPKFCNVKNGREKIESLHPSIDHILKETQGIIVYQEQVMQIAQVMAGYTLGGADSLRRAMGKKIREEMEAERPKFITGARANGVEAKKAGEIFDLLEKFADYGFNKSHAAAYGVVSYQTAWLKANYSVEFMAAVMNCDIHLTDKLGSYQAEVERLGITMVPPCVNRSQATFSVGDGAIYYALGALKNVGVEAMKAIVAGRGGRVFSDLFDLARRVDLKRIGKRPLEMLARAGAMDQLDSNRRKVLESLDALTAFSSAHFEALNSAQVSLFGEKGTDLPNPRLPMPEAWQPTQMLQQEHLAVGFYISGHPLDDYMGPLKRQRVLSLAELKQKVQGGAVAAKIAGSVSSVQIRKSARGNRFAFVELSDPTGLYEATLFADVLETARDLLVVGANVVLTVEAHLEGEGVKLLARSVVPVDSVVAAAAGAGLRVFIREATAIEVVARILTEHDQGPGGRGPVNLVLMSADLPGEVELALPGMSRITPQIRGAIKHVAGVAHVEEF